MNIKRSSLVFFFSGLLVLPSSSHAQAAYTANRPSQIQVGAGALILKPDYNLATLKGLSFWADYDFYKFIGVEATVHLGSIITPGDVAEDTYLIGPRFVYHKRRATGYGKLLIGRANIINQNTGASSSFNALGFGAGVEYKVTEHINVRPIDVEFQKWPDFQPHSLSPTALSFGVSYIIK